MLTCVSLSCGSVPVLSQPPQHPLVCLSLPPSTPSQTLSQSIRGATTSLVVDLCYLLEGHSPQELPEQLIGAVRFSNIDMAATTQLDLSSEVPSWPQPW